MSVDFSVDTLIAMGERVRREIKIVIAQTNTADRLNQAGIGDTHEIWITRTEVGLGCMCIHWKQYQCRDVWERRELRISTQSGMRLGAERL
jgi:hypothetical protein